jgi:serine/threonine protein kinase
VGRYELQKEIGRGAAGVVYLANDPRLQRPVAVKVFALPQGMSPEQKSEFRQRFIREAQAAARLSHPGIVTVYDAGEDAERRSPFIAMEYVPGRSLRQSLDADGHLDAERAIAMAGRLAEALQVAHEAGIIHRDVKPANILLHEEDGGVKIADFGVARLPTSELTRSGTSIGSPAYMSPEQIRGRPVDGRSDLFSLAVILYESLTGKRPFTGEDVAAVIYSVVSETPAPITSLAPDLPPGLDRFFDRALAKDPADRFGCGRSFKTALEEAAGEKSSPPLRIGYTHSRGWLLAGAALLLTVTLGAWAWLGGEEDARIELHARSAVANASLSLLVDGKEVYSRQLSAPARGKFQLKKFLRKNQEVFDALIEIPAGKHEVVAQVVPKGAAAGYSDSVVLHLQPGETRKLRMVAGLPSRSALSLRAD